MATVSMAGALVRLLVHLGEIPAALGVIFNDAFTGQAVAGGAFGTVFQLTPVYSFQEADQQAALPPQR